MIPTFYKLTDRSELGRAEYESNLFKSLQGKHFLLLHSVALLPSKYMQMDFPTLRESISKVPGARRIEDLAFREQVVTYFHPGRPFFLDWIEIEGESRYDGTPTPIISNTLIRNARKIVSRRATRFYQMFKPYDRWVKEVQFHVAREYIKHLAPNRVVAYGTVLVLAEVEPSPIVQQASRQGLIELVVEGTTKQVKSFVNVTSLAKARQFQSWLQQQTPV